MAYVPGLEHDLFLSYSSRDSLWVDPFRAALQLALGEKLGWEVSVWQDKNELRVGENWTDEIEAAIGHAAAFLAVLSPSYKNSLWCTRERKFFLDALMARVGSSPEAGDGISRLLKIIKTPWPDRAHEDFLAEYQQLAFFEAGLAARPEREFVPGTKEFQERIDELAHALTSLLRAMRRTLEPVFVASPPATENIFDDYEALRGELRKQRYDVRPDGLLDASYSDKLVVKEMESAKLSVHLIGSQFDPFTEHQIRLASELERPLVIWIKPGAEQSADARQKQFIEDVRNARNLPDRFTLLEKMNVRAMIREVLELLRPRPERQSATTNGSSLYLLYDRTSPNDSKFAESLGDKIRQEEKLNVLVPFNSDGASGPEVHERLLGSCDGVLLYGEEAPKPWFNSFLMDVLLAEARLNRAPMKSKGMLVHDPSAFRGLPANVNVIQRSDHFDLKQLERVLAPLRADTNAA